jgi:hypothetical protein
MSPSSREAGEARSLEDWDTWVDRAIREAQRRGDFDNLPGAGKPLAIDDNPFAGELGTAFGLLKNAGMAPPWIELDKEVRAAEAALREQRERIGRRLRERLASVAAVSDAAESDGPKPNADDGQSATKRRWPFSLRRPNDQPLRNSNRPEVAHLEAERQRARRDYVDRAAQLDSKIAEYNALLPEALRWRQRARLTPEQAGHAFDTACPPILDEARRG